MFILDSIIYNLFVYYLNPAVYDPDFYQACYFIPELSVSCVDFGSTKETPRLKLDGLWL